MKYLSVCSGIEAATVAWHSLGWQAVGFAEIEKFPAKVLAHHYPSVPNFGDLTQHDRWPLEGGSVDLLVGGTPCQSFSVAGLRRGLDDSRGQLTIEYVRLAQRLRPRWIVWENVPGVLSSGGGRDFGSFLGALAELGYGVCYRVLDAEYFGVAQRRRRVFVVGYLGDWRRAAAVLFERESVRGDPAPIREARQRVAPSVTTGAPFSRTGNDRVEAEAVVVSKQWPAEVAPTLNADFGSKQGLEDQHALGGAGHFVPASPIAFSQNQLGEVRTGEVMNTLNTNSNASGRNTPMMAVPIDMRNAQRDPDKHDAVNRQGTGVAKDGDPAHTVTSACVQGVATAMQVRRLTPVECERLQGFPDGYTDIRPSGKDTPDGPRYKALGNSMAVPVMRWIGERIAKVEDLSKG